MKLLDRHDLGNLEPVTTEVEVDSLAIILCTYFAGHMDRPEEDEATENDDNYHWGDWVIKMVDQTLDKYAEEVNEICQRSLSSSG